MIFDTLDKLETYIPVIPQLRQVADAMDHDDIYSKSKGHYTTPAEDVDYEVCTYMSSTSETPFVFHRNKTIVEIVLEGDELACTTWRELTKDAQAYNKTSDTGLINGGEVLCVAKAAQGRFCAFLPGEPYRTSSSGTPAHVKKVIFTINE